jgi:hypothetical protein
MVTRSPEGGDKPGNSGLSDFKVLREHQGLSHRIQKPEEPKQQPSDSRWESYDRFFRKGPMRPAVLEGVPPRRHNGEGIQPTPQTPSEQRGEPEASKLNPAEQQAVERLGKPPPEEAVVETLDPKIEEMIRRAARGNPKEAARLRELAKTDAGIRQFLIEGPISLASSSPDLSILRIFRKSEDSS